MYRRLFQRSFHRQEFQREDGSHWDLSKHSRIEELFALLEKEKPSPPCGPFSQLQNLVDVRNLGARSICELQRAPIVHSGRRPLLFARASKTHVSIDPKMENGIRRRVGQGPKLAALGEDAI